MSCRSILILLSVFGLAACGEASPPAAPAEPTPVATPPAVPALQPLPVYSVDSMTFEVRESMPVQLVIKARGTVRTGGWTNAELRPLQTLVPEQGLRSFTLVATPPRPDMMVTQALAPVEATFTIPALPDDVKQIRILAETNEKTETLP
jgi:hypothetical protein